MSSSSTLQAEPIQELAELITQSNYAAVARFAFLISEMGESKSL